MALIFSRLLYVPIVAYRMITVIRFRPVGGMTLAIAVLEVILLIFGVILFLQHRLSG